MSDPSKQFTPKFRPRFEDESLKALFNRYIGRLLQTLDVASCPEPIKIAVKKSHWNLLREVVEGGYLKPEVELKTREENNG